MIAAGIFLIAVPIAFNLAFARLAATFDYPDVLREPTHDVLAKFRAGGRPLIVTWWAFAMTALLMVPLVVLTADAYDAPQLTTTVGVLAALVQLLGLIRWPFLVPYLATHADDPATDVVFQAFHRYLGVAVGEHLGYLLTGVWTILIATALALPLAIAGVLIGALLALCAGPAEKLTPVAYVAWSLWLILTGVSTLA